MKISRILITIVFLAGLAGGIFAGGCKGEETAAIKVVTSTSHLEQLVKRIGGEMVGVINIVPPASHPGDFDASPSDIQNLADADLFLWHNWPGEVYVTGLIESADNPDLPVIAIEISGSWMTPPVQLQAADEVAEALGQVDSENSAAYQEAAESYKESISAKGEELRARLDQANVSSVNVICAGWQAGFLGWAGFNVVNTYGLPTAPTLSQIESLIEEGKAEQVSLVIDNLHDAPDAGKPIAEGIGCKRIVLINFPGPLPGTETWEEAVDYNVDLLLEALNE